MNLFKIDFLEKLAALLKEAFKFKKYKAMPYVAAIFVGISVIPFVIASYVVAAALAILAFFLRVILSPFDYLRGLVNGEGKEVKHATQFIIYLISWPIVFMGYVLSAFLLIAINILYAQLVIYTYIWTLGGFKFHISATKAENIEIEVSTKYNTKIWVTHIASYYSLFVMFLIGEIVCYVLDGGFSYALPFGYYLLITYGIAVLQVYAALNVFIVLAPNPKQIERQIIEE